ncbi:hypothetical protein F7Q99_36255 [Streptomyces kaniharaensis]|uniref:Uncharacterized protein n=1 Tax=Streptomyces kaniharaensis TaxID=212423 RepID=A0A6N7L0I3_9ACTN|nr:hypothetical protein [Streptomyces kaniharaensis]MQS17496.1 hypothetical protein [Streptomyces kaniharaensis]
MSLDKPLTNGITINMEKPKTAPKAEAVEFTSTRSPRRIAPVFLGIKSPFLLLGGTSWSTVVAVSALEREADTSGES